MACSQFPEIERLLNQLYIATLNTKNTICSLFEIVMLYYDNIVLGWILGLETHRMTMYDNIEISKIRTRSKPAHRIQGSCKHKTKINSTDKIQFRNSTSFRWIADKKSKCYTTFHLYKIKGNKNFSTFRTTAVPKSPKKLTKNAHAKLKQRRLCILHKIAKTRGMFKVLLSICIDSARQWINDAKIRQSWVDDVWDLRTPVGVREIELHFDFAISGARQSFCWCLELFSDANYVTGGWFRGEILSTNRKWSRSWRESIWMKTSSTKFDLKSKINPSFLAFGVTCGKILLFEVTFYALQAHEHRYRALCNPTY